MSDKTPKIPIEKILFKKHLSAKEKIDELVYKLNELEEKLNRSKEEKNTHKNNLSGKNLEVLQLKETKSALETKLKLYIDSIDQPELVPWLIEKVDSSQRETSKKQIQLDNEKFAGKRGEKEIVRLNELLDYVKTGEESLTKNYWSWRNYAERLEEDVENLKIERDILNKHFKENQSKENSQSEESSNVLTEKEEKSYLKIIKNNCANLEDKMAEHVKGQDKAITTIKKKLVAHFSGLREDIPTVFFLHGSTGVGKTYVVEILNDVLFKNLPTKPKLLVANMSEYYDKHVVSKLIGSPPGYVGYNDESVISKHVNDNPSFSIVLLDEIEKAHPNIYNFFLHVFDKGTIEDGKNNTHQINKYIFFLTSNAGEHLAQKKKTIGGFVRDTEQETREIVIEDTIKDIFSPEFRNRISAKIHFDFLTKEAMDDILEVEFNKINDRALMNYGKGIFLSNAARNRIKDIGFDKRTGARYLKRTLEEQIQGSSSVINLLEEGKNVFVDYQQDKFVYKNLSQKKKNK
jgi:ATP-dependent Clp protease ATP-binding subunit ClpC